MSLLKRVGALLIALALPFTCVSAENRAAQPAADAFAAAALADQPEDALIAAPTRKPWLATPAPTPDAPVPTPEPEPTNPLADESGAFTLLLIGTDNYEPDTTGRSDAMILVQVRDDSIKLISFLRDLYVKIPGHGRTRLNAAYVYGGAELLKQTLAENFGVSVDRTLAVNFSLMVELIDQLGGVTVDVSTSERKQLNAILKYYNKQNGVPQSDGLLEQAGSQTLTGKQALSFSRIRKIDDDFHRTGRQRVVIEAIFNRLRELDTFSLAALLTANIGNVTTDVTIADALALVPVLLHLNDVSLEGMSVPVAGGYTDETRNGMMVLVPNLAKSRAAIEAFLGE